MSNSLYQFFLCEDVPLTARPPSRMRAILMALTITGIVLTVAGVLISLSGGIRTEFFGLPVRATNPARPLSLGVLLLVVRLMLAGRLGRLDEWQPVRRMFRPGALAAALAVLLACTAWTTNYGVGGGSDSFGYLSQADLWLAGDLTVEHEWLRDAPWPNKVLSATPLGYRPSVSGESSVPIYAPGLPLMLAGSKLLFGQCGFILLIALMAGVLVGATYSIGARVASPSIGAGAALLVATSPAVLFIMASPMSDVPAAAMSALAILGCVHRSRTTAFLAGLAMAAVILIRPNLAPLGAVFALWLFALDRGTPFWSARIVRTGLFCLAAAAGVVGLALFNHSLYGSATASGYGTLEGFFSPSHILPNIANYTMWLIHSQTPLALLGLLSLAVPFRWLGKRQDIRDLSLLILVAVSVTALYLPYMAFDRWWYLRFFLPAWPVLALGTAWLLTDRTGRHYSSEGLALLLLMGFWGLLYAKEKDAFRVGWDDLRYVSAAHLVSERTSPQSVILAMQHSGSVTYYSGRRSLRYDWLEPQGLESAVAWLKEQGHDVYVLLDDWEVEKFRTQFKDTPYGALPDDHRIVLQDVGTRVLLFDTRPHDGEMRRTIREFLPSARRCSEPVRQPLTGSRP